MFLVHATLRVYQLAIIMQKVSSDVHCLRCNDSSECFVVDEKITKVVNEISFHGITS